MTKRDNHLAARALADWARHRFARSKEHQIADTYGVAARTLWRWKDALDDDAELSALYKEAVQAHITHDWADQLNNTISAAVTKLHELIEASDDLSAVTEAFAKLSEVAIAKEMLHGALNGEEAHGRPAVDASYGGHASPGPN